jgi:hypothetical protein
VLHFICIRFYPKNELDVLGISDFYPLSVFRFRKPETWQFIFAVLSCGLFLRVWPKFENNASQIKLICAGLLFALLSNFLNGWRYGIDYPTATCGDQGIEYYHDAILVRGPVWFLSRFNSIQAALLPHARTHPPGPVLLYYFLHLLLRDPGVISIAIAAISLAISLPALNRLIILAFGRESSSGVLLYAILPAILIYGLASVDAVIASLFIQVIVNFIDEEKKESLFLSAFFLALALFFSFGSLFLIPILVGFDLSCRKSIKRSLVILGIAALLLASLIPAAGFNWMKAFLGASTIENEKGFLLFGNPRRYFWYRLGAVAEIMFFFTPFLSLVGWKGIETLKKKSPKFYRLFLLGPATLTVMLLSGAMKIGEAARICMFILPFLMLPVWAEWDDLDKMNRKNIAFAVWIWSTGMQLFGFFEW